MSIADPNPTPDPDAIRARIAAEAEAFAVAVAELNADEASRIQTRINGLKAELAGALPVFDAAVTR